MTNNPHYVIVGNGPAGNAAAETLREKDSSARITIISDEPFHFYQRCKLPEYAAGMVPEDELWLRTAEDYKLRDIKLRLGQKVVEIDIAGSSLLLDHKERIHFDTAILATGGRPRIPEKLKHSASHIRTLKTLVDARHWKNELKNAERILLIGGDLVSVRFARSLRKAGKEVTLSLWDEAFWPLELDQTLASRIVESLSKQGITVRADLPFSNCTPTAGGISCHFKDGEVETFDIVGGFFGYEPEVAVLGRTGLHLDKGVIVDEHLKTNAKGIYAAGDAAQVYSPEMNNYWVSVGWNNAEALGRLAACNVLGHDGHATKSKQSYLNIEGIRINTSWWTEV
jgi:nitrite reductase (NADH) large subunit